MCAKVTGPLMSMSASGKVGKSLVFFPHLGRNVVRGLVTPRNTKTEAQGAVRLLLGALGRAAKAPKIGGNFLTALKDVVPSGQTWVSDYVSFSIQAFGNPQGLNSAYEGHDAEEEFASEANNLGLTDMKISYAGSTDTITGGAILFALANYAAAISAQNPDIFGSGTPWDKPFSSWDSSEVTAFVSALQA